MGICSNQTVANRFEPFNTITSDMSTNYSEITVDIFSLTNTAFQNSQYLGSSSSAAYWLLLLGTICAVLALVALVFSFLTFPEHGITISMP